VPIWLTHGTFRRLKDKRLIATELFHAHAAFTLGDITVDPFPTPHDAAESCQFRFSNNDVSFVVATDLGVCTPFILQKIQGANGILIECNYDDEMLRNGPYPLSLQRRIRSNFGHLGNAQAGPLIRAIEHSRLERILLGHLSEKNNTDAHARDAILASLPTASERITVLQQHSVSEWFTLRGEPFDTTAETTAQATVRART